MVQAEEGASRRPTGMVPVRLRDASHVRESRRGVQLREEPSEGDEGARYGVDVRASARAPGDAQVRGGEPQLAERCDVVNLAVRKAYAEYDVAVPHLLRKARSEGASIPCGPGCDHCCYDVAWVIDEEADELAERVRSMPKARREVVLAATRAWLDGMHAAGLNPDRKFPDLRVYHRARLACPLLDREHHTCKVYDIRPLSCRSHFVNAPTSEPCANRANEPTIETVQCPELLEHAFMMIVTTPEHAQRTRDALLPRALGKRLGVE